MTWKIRKVKNRAHAQLPGDYWLCPELVDSPDVKPAFLSSQYWLETRHRRWPIMMLLPDGSETLLDGVGQGLVVMGEDDKLTARPAIIGWGYRGWLTDGILGGDIDGRSYGGQRG